jgi:hypothetical protein
MRKNHEEDEMPRLHSKLTCRAEAEAAWLRGSVLGGSARTTAAPPHAEREQRIREAAYFKAKARGFAPGGELEDWLAAEAALSA